MEGGQPVQAHHEKLAPKETPPCLTTLKEKCGRVSLWRPRSSFCRVEGEGEKAVEKAKSTEEKDDGGEDEPSAGERRRSRG